jgi:hypothetical protein
MCISCLESLHDRDDVWMAVGEHFPMSRLYIVTMHEPPAVSARCVVYRACAVLGLGFCGACATCHDQRSAGNARGHGRSPDRRGVTRPTSAPRHV